MRVLRLRRLRPQPTGQGLFARLRVSEWLTASFWKQVGAPRMSASGVHAAPLGVLPQPPAPKRLLCLFPPRAAVPSPGLEEVKPVSLPRCAGRYARAALLGSRGGGPHLSRRTGTLCGVAVPIPPGAVRACLHCLYTHLTCSLRGLSSSHGSIWTSFLQKKKKVFLLYPSLLIFRLKVGTNLTKH